MMAGAEREDKLMGKGVELRILLLDLLSLSVQRKLSLKVSYNIIKSILYLQLSSADGLSTVCTQVRPDNMSGLIWFQTV